MAAAGWCWQSISAVSPSVGWGWAGTWEGTQPGQLTKLTKGDSTPYAVWSTIKAKIKEERGEQEEFVTYDFCLLEQLLPALNPGI